MINITDMCQVLHFNYKNNLTNCKKIINISDICKVLHFNYKNNLTNCKKNY